MKTVAWYSSKSEEKHVTQIIVQLPPDNEIPAVTDSKLLADPGFRNANWAATVLVRSDSQMPAIFAKASRVADQLRGNPARVVFSFYRLNDGGILQIFVSVDSPELKQKFGQVYLAEYPFWLDEEKDRQMANALLSNEILQLFFVAPDQNDPCKGYFGLEGKLPADCLNALKREWQALQAYHKGIAVRNFDLCLRQYNSENPLEQSPILDQQVAAETGRPAETLGAIFQALTSGEVKEGDLLEIRPDGTVEKAEGGYGLTDRDIIELWQHGIRKVGEFEITRSQYEMALTSLDLGGSQEFTALARDLIREKEKREKPKAKAQKEKRKVTRGRPAPVPIESWRLAVVPAVVILSLNLVGFIIFRWLLFVYILVNLCFVLCAGIYFAYRLYLAGQWPPPQSKSANPKDELTGCIAGIFGLGIVLAILAGVFKVRNEIMAPIAIGAMVLYTLLQFMIYQKLVKVTILYTILARLPEIVIVFFFLPGESDIRLLNVVGFTLGSPMYLIWFGMITTTILASGGESVSEATTAISESTTQQPEPSPALGYDQAKRCYWHGMKLSKQEDWKGAAAEFARAVELEPTSSVYHYAFAIAKNKSAPEGLTEEELKNYYLGVCELFEKAMKLDSGKGNLKADDFQKIAFTCGLIYRSMEKYQQALQILIRGIKRNPDNRELLELRAWSEFDLGMQQAAEATLSHLLKLHPQSEEGRRLWKQIRKAQGKELTLDLPENKKMEIYRDYKQACDRAFVQKYMPQRSERQDLDFVDLVAEMNRIGSQATTDVRKNILKKYEISEFDLNLILQEGERNSWPVQDS